MAEVNIQDAKKKEAYIAMEFFRIAKNALNQSKSPEARTSLEEVLPEFSIGSGYADLLLLVKSYGKVAPWMIVECKQRTLTKPGVSYANAMMQAWKYAEILPVRFLAVYDGWLILVFQRVYPYLVGVYSCELDKDLNETMISDLLIGLMEHDYYGSQGSNRLSRLSKPHDLRFLEEKILPPISTKAVKRYGLTSKEQMDEKTVKNRSQQLLNEWIQNIHK